MPRGISTMLSAKKSKKIKKNRKSLRNMIHQQKMNSRKKNKRDYPNPLIKMRIGKT
jgi:hypothetical protein